MTRSHQSTDNSDFNVKTTIFEDSTRQYFLVSRNFPVLMAMWGAKTNRPQKWGKICSKNLKLQNQLQHKRKCPSSLIAQDGWKGDTLFSNDLGKFSEVQWQSFYGQPSMFAQVKTTASPSQSLTLPLGNRRSSVVKHYTELEPLPTPPLETRTAILDGLGLHIQH